MLFLIQNIFKSENTIYLKKKFKWKLDFHRKHVNDIQDKLSYLRYSCFIAKNKILFGTGKLNKRQLFHWLNLVLLNY